MSRPKSTDRYRFNRYRRWLWHFHEAFTQSGARVPNEVGAGHDECRSYGVSRHYYGISRPANLHTLILLMLYDAAELRHFV